VDGGRKKRRVVHVKNLKKWKVGEVNIRRFVVCGILKDRMILGWKVSSSKPNKYLQAVLNKLSLIILVTLYSSYHA